MCPHSLGNNTGILLPLTAISTRLAEPVTVLVGRRAGGEVRGQRLGPKKRAATRGVAAYSSRHADAMPSQRMPSPCLDGPLLGYSRPEAGARSRPNGHTRCVPAPNQLS